MGPRKSRDDHYVCAMKRLGFADDIRDFDRVGEFFSGGDGSISGVFAVSVM